MKPFFPLFFIFFLLTACSAKEQAHMEQSKLISGADTNIYLSETADQKQVQQINTADEDFLDDSEFDEMSTVSKEPIADPLEPWNRIWFTFNDIFYLKLYKPIYEGYKEVVHEDIRSGLSNALHNFGAPIRIVNSILQLKLAQAVVEFGRFLINSVFGGAGLLEIVPQEKALVPVNLASADFGGTLHTWGFGEGIYMIWPVIGPGTLRDSIGFAADRVTSLSFWVSKPIGNVRNEISYSTLGILSFNDYGSMLESYETLTKAAIEPYSALRDAWIQIRRNALAGKKAADKEEKTSGFILGDGLQPFYDIRLP